MKNKIHSGLLSNTQIDQFLADGLDENGTSQPNRKVGVSFRLDLDTNQIRHSIYTLTT